jgi:hypothetical protein
MYINDFMFYNLKAEVFYLLTKMTLQVRNAVHLIVVFRTVDDCIPYEYVDQVESDCEQFDFISQNDK